MTSKNDFAGHPERLARPRRSLVQQLDRPRAGRLSRTARLRGLQARRLPRQDRAFAQSLLHARLIDINTLRSRVDTLPAEVDPRVTRQLHSWLDAQKQR
ncbi:MAG: hypothetical protein ACRDRX_00415 [Pseudonocardiaceae bacterium]